MPLINQLRFYVARAAMLQVEPRLNPATGLYFEIDKVARSSHTRPRYRAGIRNRLRSVVERSPKHLRSIAAHTSHHRQRMQSSPFSLSPLHPLPTRNYSKQFATSATKLTAKSFRRTLRPRPFRVWPYCRGTATRTTGLVMKQERKAAFHQTMITVNPGSDE